MKELDELLQSNKLFMLYFSASWCLPCQSMKKVIHILSKKRFFGKIKVIEVNTDKFPLVSRKFNINGVPCFIFIKKQKEVYRCVGAKSQNQMESIIKGLKKGVIYESN